MATHEDSYERAELFSEMCDSNTPDEKLLSVIEEMYAQETGIPYPKNIMRYHITHLVGHYDAMEPALLKKVDAFVRDTVTPEEYERGLQIHGALPDPDENRSVDIQQPAERTE